MTDILAPFKGETKQSPVDRLKIARDIKAELEKLERNLEAQVIAGVDRRGIMMGDHFTAQKKVQSRQGALDERRLRERFGSQIEEFRRPGSTSIRVEITPRRPVSASIGVDIAPGEVLEEGDDQ